MKFTLNKDRLYIYILMGLVSLLAASYFQLSSQYSRVFSDSGSLEKRVIKCEVPLEGKMIQNVYYVAESLQDAKQLLFNSKNGLFFDNSLYIKTQDFNGVDHIVAFKDITCDAVGTQVSLVSGAY